MRMNRAGFTLMELIVVTAIFTGVVIAFITAFVFVARVNVTGSTQAEVATQSQFLLQTVQYYIERSSLVDMATNTATSTLRLRMSSAATDPVVIGLANGAVTLSVGGGAAQSITSSKVNVTNLGFTRLANAPGHDSVAISFTVANNTANSSQMFSQGLASAVARTYAATFDSDLLPSSNFQRQLGAGVGDWKSINDTIFFTTPNHYVGIGNVQFTPTAALHLTDGDVYVASSTRGIILKSPSNTCFRVTVSASGTLGTASIACP